MGEAYTRTCSLQGDTVTSLNESHPFSWVRPAEQVQEELEKVYPLNESHPFSWVRLCTRVPAEPYQTPSMKVTHSHG